MCLSVSVKEGVAHVSVSPNERRHGLYVNPSKRGMAW